MAKYEQYATTGIKSVEVKDCELNYIVSVDDLPDRIVVSNALYVHGLERGLVTDIKINLFDKKFDGSRSIADDEPIINEIEYKDCVLVYVNRGRRFDRESAPDTCDYTFFK